MLRWSVICLVLGLIIVALGLAGISGSSVDVGKVVAVLLPCAIIAALASSVRERKEDR